MDLKLPSVRISVGAERRDNLENPSVDLVQALIAITDGATSSSVNLTPYKAMRLTSVYAAIRVIAESIASLPIQIRQVDGRSRSKVDNDPRANLLNVSPNVEQTPMEVLETWIANALLWGRGYMYSEWDNGGRPVALWTLRPDRTEEHRTPSGQLYYTTTLRSGETVPLPAEQVIPLKSIYGLSPIMSSREAVAGVIAADEYAFRFWANNARPGGVIETNENWDEEQFAEFRRRWRAGHEGLKRSQLVGILSGGATWRDVGVPPQMAQMIEARNFGVREIARLFRVPPHMIADLEGSVTRASIEQQSIEFVIYTLRPWLVRAEQALRNGLFLGKKDMAAEVYAEFITEGLMRGDIKSRYDAYAVGVQWGWLSRNDIREFEQLLPVLDQNLDEFLVPMNMTTSKLIGTAPQQSLQGGALEAASALSQLALMLRGRPESELAVGKAIEALQQARREFGAVDEPARERPSIELTVPSAPIELNMPDITVEQPDIRVDVAAPHVTVQPAKSPSVRVEVPPAQVEVTVPSRRRVTLLRDASGQLTGATLEELDDEEPPEETG